MPTLKVSNSALLCYLEPKTGIKLLLLSFKTLDILDFECDETKVFWFLLDAFWFSLLFTCFFTGYFFGGVLYCWWGLCELLVEKFYLVVELVFFSEDTWEK